jgi:teichuronic acid biosynthesis glycosyltransferase TuaC
MGLNLLTVTTLYPNAEMPFHGIFVENRLREILKIQGMRARVVAPVPWFPLTAKGFGRYGRFARVPREECRSGVAVFHPRFMLLPKVGMRGAAGSLFRALKAFACDRNLRSMGIDLVDGQYLYPDAVAAVRLSRWLGVPVVVTARGSDVTQIARFPSVRPAILGALREANAVIAVSRSLKEGLVDLGVTESSITVLRNGVDLELFRPLPRGSHEPGLGVAGKLAVTVGHLIPRKGQDIVLKAVAQLPEVSLLVVGEGPEERRLRALAGELGLGSRVRFMGARAPSELAAIYSAADVSVLASSREGWANVLLESMACGRPVVASAVGGTPEVMEGAPGGRLVAERTPEAFAQALRETLSAPPSADDIRGYAEGFGWGEVARQQANLYADVVAKARRMVADNAPAAAPMASI